MSSAALVRNAPNSAAHGWLRLGFVFGFVLGLFAEDVVVEESVP